MLISAFAASGHERPTRPTRLGVCSRTRGLSSLALGLLFLGCAPATRGPGPDDPGPAADLAPAAADLAGSEPAGPDLAYACGAYSNYTARVEGLVRSPCAYDVSRVLSIGGNVKTRIQPPTIHMEFPDGTVFSGESDGRTFSARRIQQFPFEDGCTWQATETLVGSIDTAGACTLRATYAYREAPLSPPPCAQACTIDAQVVIERTSIRVD